MLITLLVFILILGVLVFVHELGHFLVAKANGVRVVEFAFGFRPRIFAKKIGETTYALNLIPLGGYVRLWGEDFSEVSMDSLRSKRPFHKLQILVAGAAMNLLLAWIILTTLFITGFNPLFSGVDKNPFPIKGQEVTITNVAAGSPAYTNGILAGDKVMAINGDKIITAMDMIEKISIHSGENITVTIERSGAQKDIVALVRENPPATEGALGVALQGSGSVKTINWYQAPAAALYEMGRIVGLSVKGFADFVGGLVIKQKVSDQVTGMIGIGQMTGATRRLGFSYLIQLVAIVSAGLGVMNLMPILPLDGGHVFILIFEKILKREMTEKEQNILAMLGMAFILMLFIVVTYKDIVRFDVLKRIMGVF